MTRSPLDQALEQRAVVVIREATLERRDRQHRIISDSAAHVTDEDQVLGAVMVFRDVTEQKALQKQLEVADRLASLGTMAAGVAHEVNNPLAVVVANAWLIEEELKRSLAALRAGGAPSEELFARLEDAIEAQSEVKAAASRIGGIVADLKTFARPTEHTPGQADAARAIGFALRTTAHELRHRARTVTEVFEVPPVAIDESKLGQVLVNLLLNAAHAIALGQAQRNQVTVTARPGEHGRVHIEIHDTGSGMKPEVLGRIFEPFFTTKPVGEGTGLGLSICHGIITAAGGEMRVESRLGQGTVFSIRLPVARETTAVTPAIVTPRGERRGRILVVDDEEMVLRAVARILKQHEVICAGSAYEALGFLGAGERFDIIFSDLVTPSMTGIEFYEELLLRHPEAARRVVFLTGGAVNGRLADFLAAVRNPLVEKPFEVEALQNMVQQLLAQGDAGRAPTRWA